MPANSIRFVLDGERVEVRLGSFKLDDSTLQGQVQYDPSAASKLATAAVSAALPAS